MIAVITENKINKSTKYYIQNKTMESLLHVVVWRRHWYSLKESTEWHNCWRHHARWGRKNMERERQESAEVPATYLKTASYARWGDLKNMWIFGIVKWYLWEILKEWPKVRRFYHFYGHKNMIHWISRRQLTPRKAPVEFHYKDQDGARLRPWLKAMTYWLRIRLELLWNVNISKNVLWPVNVDIKNRA